MTGPSSTVRNMRTGEERTYSLPARRALIAASRQARGDYNTWDYPIDDPAIEVGTHFYFLGDLAVRKEQVERRAG